MCVCVWLCGFAPVESTTFSISLDDREALSLCLISSYIIQHAVRLTKQEWRKGESWSSCERVENSFDFISTLTTGETPVAIHVFTLDFVVFPLFSPSSPTPREKYVLSGGKNDLKGKVAASSHRTASLTRCFLLRDHASLLLQSAVELHTPLCSQKSSFC